ncbi:hypothetical protein CEXT_131571, partial [Caerostris extrusa]
MSSFILTGITKVAPRVLHLQSLPTPSGRTPFSIQENTHHLQNVLQVEKTRCPLRLLQETGFPR